MKLNFKATLAIIRAHFSFYKMLKNNQLLRKKSSQSQNYFLRKNIIIDFFVLRMLNFKDLNKNYK